MKDCQIYQTRLYKEPKFSFSAFPLQDLPPKKSISISARPSSCISVAGCVEENLDTFFSHENQTCPPPPLISQFGKLRSSSNSDLIKCFEQHCNAYEKELNGLSNCFKWLLIIDTLKPGQSKTFKDYATNVSLHMSEIVCEKFSVKMFFWDNYFHDSLKTQTLEKHGKEYGQEPKLRQECLTTGILSSWSTKVKKSYSAIFPTN